MVRFIYPITLNGIPRRGCIRIGALQETAKEEELIIVPKERAIVVVGGKIGGCPAPGFGEVSKYC